MRAFFTFTWIAIFALATFSLAGCGGGLTKKDGKKAAAHDDHGHDHEHPEEGPHGGHLIELGDHEYHAEWTHDDDSGKVTVYILDKTMKKNVPIEAETIAIQTKVGDNAKAFDLEAVNRTTDEKPTAFQFEITDKTLIPILEAVDEKAATSATIRVEIAGKQYTGKFEHHDHDHGHKH